jgi:serine/threonine protein kinase
MEIMHGAIEPISASYDRGMMEILGLMLDRDPLNRPNADAILSHRLVAPVVHKISTSLGSFARSDHDSPEDSRSTFHWDIR